jgi:hypothetical protein
MHTIDLRWGKVMNKKRKKRENFLPDCEDYPRGCADCELVECHCCDTPLCWWMAVVTETESFCRHCADILEIEAWTGEEE